MFFNEHERVIDSFFNQLGDGVVHKLFRTYVNSKKMYDVFYILEVDMVLIKSIIVHYKKMSLLIWFFRIIL
jgi:hypothetical protein